MTTRPTGDPPPSARLPVTALSTEPVEVDDHSAGELVAETTSSPTEEIDTIDTRVDTSLFDAKSQPGVLSQGLTTATRSGSTLSVKPGVTVGVAFDGSLKGHATTHSLLMSSTRAFEAAAIKVGDELGLSESYLGRLALLGAQGLANGWGTLLQHELGHIHAGEQDGHETYLEYIKLFSGMSVIEGPLSDEDLFRFQVGGLNRSSQSAISLFDGIARHGGHATLNDAILMLTTRLDDLFYIGRTWNQDNRDQVWHAADPANIRNTLARFGVELSYQHMFTKALVADLLSAPFWQSLAATTDYVRTGDRHWELKRWSAGGLDGYMPSVELQRSIKGDNFHVSTVVNPDNNHPLGLSLDIRTELTNWDVNAIGATVEFINAMSTEKFGNLRFSPRIGVHTPLRQSRLGARERTTFSFGGRFQADISNQMSVIGDIAYGPNATTGELRPEILGSISIIYRF